MIAIKKLLESIGAAVLLFLASMRYLPTAVTQTRRIVDQCWFIGYKTLPIVVLLSGFIGGVLALNTGYSVREYNVSNFIGGVVGLSMVRELGPVMTAFLLAGRVGSAITAELASMKVYNEVDSLIIMNVPPERCLVLPRLIAGILIMPVLTMASIAVGWAGGAVVAEAEPVINLSPEVYYRNLIAFMEVKDVIDGLIKGEIFAVFIITICCAVGLDTKGGPREVGRSVTKAVVASMFSILLLDYFVTKILIA